MSDITISGGLRNTVVDLRTPLLQEHDEGIETSSVHANEIHIGGGIKVGLRAAPLGESIDQLRQESRQRLGEPRGFGSKALNAIGTVLTMVVALPVKAAATVIGTIGGLVLGGIVKGLEALVGLPGTVKGYQSTIRNWAGQPMQGSVLNKDFGGVDQTVGDKFTELLNNRPPGSRPPTDEVLKYAAMGERIVTTLFGDMDATADLSRVPIKIDGETHELRADLETVRAISWYLQVKAIADNADHGAPALLDEGAMVAKDPGNRLYSFLRSSDNAYGRVSSHMQERSDSVPTGFSALTSLWKGGFAAMLGSGFAGQPLQYGIEDFDNRMPSKGGTLLFDKLKPSGGPQDDPEIYLKWESKGVPNSFGVTGTHANLSLGDKLLNRGLAFFRSLGHTINFASDANPQGYRGEKLQKGEAGEIYNDFTQAVNRLSGVDANVKERIIGHAGKYGAVEMSRVIDAMLKSDEVQGEENQDSRTALQDVQQSLNKWMGRMGPDLGIARKGNEVHLSLR